MESSGYDSLAIHPFEKTNYNRNAAYEYMDFDKTVWEDDFDANADRMRGYISDHALTEKLLKNIKSIRQKVILLGLIFQYQCKIMVDIGKVH